ncbi:UPF0182 family membrane protein [Maribellus mangrovi]|uniref:UPF0182 family membrane protein n=1 Tax=Maribellus mangrovi TaxID=3133146 RepID=UPI0030EC8AED
MYTALFLVFIALAIFLIYKGVTAKKVSVIATGAVIALITLLFSGFMDFWGEKLWFDQLGYNDRFWTVWFTKIGLFIVAFIVAGLYVYLLTFSLKKGNQKLIRYLTVLISAILSGLWLYSDWEVVLKFLFRIDTSITEPVLNMQTGFYLFVYPFLELIYSTFISLTVFALIASVIASFKKQQDGNSQITFREDFNENKSLFVSIGVLLIVLACGKFLDRFGLLYSTEGVVSGPGWTDDNIRLPLLLIISILTAIAGVSLMVPTVRKRISGIFGKSNRFWGIQETVVIPLAAFIFWLVTLSIVPSLFQWLKVEPNEITVERPYIENNIEFTRYGFHLNKVEENEFPVSENFSQNIVSSNNNLLKNIRLWDYRALDAVFKQFQEIRLYYEFTDVDIDRYVIDGKYNEVMISAREMETRNLPAESQTFVNKRFKYTHGYGITLNRVNEFTSEGLPNLLVKDIPPVNKYDELEVKRPELYYGELANDFVVVNTDEQEFDYPSGENNIYTRYEGQGGVPLSGLWRKFLYGSKYGGTRLLLSGYPNPESRILFHRNIKERVKALAPFLDFDDDPYIVLNDGHLYWIMDAYTTSGYYPYSEPFSSMERIGYNRGSTDQSLFSHVSRNLRGKNYIRNSVKITVDAYTGAVNFYVFEEEDPLVQVYQKIFPGLLKDKADMPEGLTNHVRYPADMLLIQGLVYAKYHMTDPAVFYNQEDLWVRATEKYYNNVQPVEPYYIMWQQSGSNKMEFSLILPFTPKDKQVMIGWIAGLCDGENYGRFLAYKFPKEKRILGTQQVETKIDQDSYLSGQLTLWDQRGSNVIRGNVLAIPIDETIIYVEPIYLQSETSAYPELRLVAVMHNDNLSYAETFDEALAGLYKESESKIQRTSDESAEAAAPQTIKELIKRANNAFENYLESMQQKDFNDAGKALEDLQQSLQQLNEKTEK